VFIVWKYIKIIFYLFFTSAYQNDPKSPKLNLKLRKIKNFKSIVGSQC
jgi:hypothetical protein